MKRIMIDLDDTIVEGGYLDVLNKYLGTDYSYKDVDDYYVESLLPQEKVDEYLEYFYTQENVYNYVKIKDDVVEVLEKLSKKYQIIICSAYVDKRVPEKCGVVTKNKHDFLVKTFPYLNPKDFIFTSRKDLVDCDIKIDDKVSNLKGHGKLKLLMDGYHNQKYSEQELTKKGIKRVKNWKEVEEILL